jgi:hypothetical protein
MANSSVFAQTLLDLVSFFNKTFPENEAIATVFSRINGAVAMNMSSINDMMLSSWIDITKDMKDQIALRDLDAIKEFLDAQSQTSFLHEIGIVEIMRDKSVSPHTRVLLWSKIDAAMNVAFPQEQPAPPVPAPTPAPAPAAPLPTANAVAAALTPDKIADTIRIMGPQFLQSMGAIVSALKDVSQKPEAQVAMSALNIAKDQFGINESLASIIEGVDDGSAKKKKKKKSKHRHSHDDYDDNRQRLLAKLKSKQEIEGEGEEQVV